VLNLKNVIAMLKRVVFKKRNRRMDYSFGSGGKIYDYSIEVDRRRCSLSSHCISYIAYVSHRGEFLFKVERYDKSPKADMGVPKRDLELRTFMLSAIMKEMRDDKSVKS